MDLQPQQLVDQLIRQHSDDFAYLHHDLVHAIPMVVTHWGHTYDDPRDVHGGVFSGDVRQMMFSLFGKHKDGEVYREASFPTLTPEKGLNCSVRLVAAGGTEIRVRKWPARDLKHREREIQMPPPGQAKAAAKARKVALDDGLDEPVFAKPVVPLGSELVVLWCPTEDGAMLAEAVLALVSDIDDASRVRVWATVPLPSPRERPSAAQPMSAVAAMQLDLKDDFDHMFDRESSEAGGTPA